MEKSIADTLSPRSRKASKPDSDATERQGGAGDVLITVERTMRIIEMLADAQEGLSLSEISRQLEVNKNLAFRILNSLQALRFIRQDKETYCYRLTYKVSNLGLRQLATGRFLEECVPILQALAEKTGEHVRLAIVEDGVPIWVHSETGRRWRLIIDPFYTHELNYHAHAAGKAWLATLPDAKIRELVGKPPFPAHTKYTKTTLRELMEDLAMCRKVGYAVSYEERELGVGTIATAIMSKRTSGEPECVGVVSLAAPTARMDRSQLIACAPTLASTATHLAEIWPLRPSELLQPRAIGL